MEAEVGDLDDMGVRERGEGSGFALEAEDGLVVCVVVEGSEGMEDLDGEGAAGFKVFGAIDGTKAADADAFGELKGAEDLSEERVGGAGEGRGGSRDLGGCRGGKVGKQPFSGGERSGRVAGRIRVLVFHV